MKRFSGIRISGPSVRKRRDGLLLFPPLLPTPLQRIERGGFFQLRPDLLRYYSHFFK